MASAVDSRLAYARLSAVATASRLPTANRGSNNSYTTSWDTTAICGCTSAYESACQVESFYVEGSRNYMGGVIAREDLSAGFGGTR